MIVSFVGNGGSEWQVDLSAQLGPDGGFGRVCRGVSGRGSGVVAVKVVELKEPTVEQERLREREVSIGVKLANMTPAPENLVVSHDFGISNGVLYIVMPLAETSLAAHLEKSGGNLEPIEASSVLRSIATGLMELAGSAILHRDLKPGNVLSVNGAWKLSDFGIARDLKESRATFTFAGAGTTPYMAPEVWLDRSPTVKSDLYALGIIAIELLTGSTPFTATETGALREQHLNEVPVIPAGIDERLALLIKQLLSKEPAARPQDARSVVEVLDRVTSNLGSAQRHLVEARLRAVTRHEAAIARASEHEASQERLKDARIQAWANLKTILTDTLVEARNALAGEASLDLSKGYPILWVANIALLFEPSGVEDRARPSERLSSGFSNCQFGLPLS